MRGTIEGADSRRRAALLWAARVALLALLVAAGVIAFRRLSPEQALADRLEGASPIDVAIAAAALLGINLVNGIVLRDLVAHFGVRLPLRSWLGVTFVAGMINLISPVASASAVRAAYLKRIHDVPLTSFAVLFGATVAFGLAGTGSLGAVSLLVLGMPGGLAGVLAFAASVALVAGLALVLLIGKGWTASAVERSGVVGRVARVLLGLQTIRSDRPLLARLAVSHIVAALLYGGAVVAAFRVAGSEAGWLTAFAAAAFARMGSIVAFTPAGLGITEAFGVVSAEILGADTGCALLAMLVVRVLSSLLTLGGGAIASPFILRETR